MRRPVSWVSLRRAKTAAGQGLRARSYREYGRDRRPPPCSALQPSERCCIRRAAHKRRLPSLIHGSGPARVDVVRRRRTGFPHAPGLVGGGARHCRVRRDHDAPQGAARAARRRGSVLDAGSRARDDEPRRHAQDALSDGGGPSRRGRAHALPRRAAVGVRVRAVRLPAHLHLLRHRADALRTQPERLRDPRPGSPLPADRAGRPLRLHGDGRADDELRGCSRSRSAPSGRRDHAPADDDLDRRLDARAAPVRGRGRGADPARALAACTRGGPPLAT